MANTLDLTGNDILATSLTATSFSTGGVGIYVGAGVPSLSANKGSLYLNTTGSSTSTRLYVNNGTTTWVAVTTAS